MSDRATSAVSEDGRWFAELCWTDKPENLNWFVHSFVATGEYDTLSVSWDCEDTGQSAEDVLRAWQAFRDELEMRS